MTANEHTGVLGPMRGKGWKKGGGKEYNGDNEPTAEFVMTLDKLEPGRRHAQEADGSGLFGRGAC